MYLIKKQWMVLINHHVYYFDDLQEAEDFASYWKVSLAQKKTIKKIRSNNGTANN